MGSVAFHTLGCKVNHYESEAMMDLFKKAGYQIVNFNESADVYIINSCTVTNEAARKTRQLARKAKRENPEAVVAVVGCYTQVSPEEVKKVKGVDLMVGIANRSKIVDYIQEVRGGQSPVVDLLEWKDLIDFEDLHVEELRETTRAYVKIQEGCNQFCSYCIIPYARGPIRSRAVGSILTEVEDLVDKGVKEIILTGTHLGAFGYENQDKERLSRLLNKLVKIKGLGHIRLSSIEVTEINDQLLDLLANEQKLCPHLHLPLQSGSDSILSRMKRPYNTAEFAETVVRTRKLLNNPAITTDIIVGFPGEEQGVFAESYDFVKRMAFSRLHVFPFSPREGTPAARMKGQISGLLKKEYSQQMRELNQELMLDYQKRFIGETREVIIEDKRDTKTNHLVGMTDNYIRTLLDDQDYYQGKLLKVKLTGSYDYNNALGEIVR